MGSISIHLVCELLENRKGRIVEQLNLRIDPVAGVVVKVVAFCITVVMIVVVVAVVVVVVVMTVAVVSGVMMVV